MKYYSIVMIMGLLILGGCSNIGIIDPSQLENITFDINCTEGCNFGNATIGNSGNGTTIIYNGTGYWNSTGEYIFLVNSSSSVGIGTNAPTTKLEVLGNITADNCIMLSGTNKICAEGGVLIYYG